MRIVINPERAVQDVIKADDLPLLGWTTGPLPDQQLEQVAFSIFRWRYPETEWYHELFKAERDDCRRFVLQLRIKFLKLDRVSEDQTTPDWTVPRGLDGLDPRWLDAWFASQLANVISLHMWGRPLKQMSARVRALVKDYAETVTDDAVKLFAPILDPEYSRDTDFDGRREPEVN